ncbi:hypothetical protein PI501_03690 [Staphylococcus epidermidis]|nr:hypothetical protein [Staphylococcus epidermidis]
MKQLMIRNLKLRSWTLIIYALLLLFFPIINYLTHNDSHIPMIYSYFLNYGLLFVSSIFLVINYLIQIKKIKY